MIRTYRNKSFHRLFAQDVAGAAAHVALFDKRLETAAEINGFSRFVGREHVAQILDYHVRVVVGLQKPIGFVRVFAVDVLEGLFRFPPEVIPPFAHW